MKKYLGFDQKLTMLSPFSYSKDKSAFTTLKDERYLFDVVQRNNVSTQDYFDFGIDNEFDIIVSPCE